MKKMISVLLIFFMSCVMAQDLVVPKEKGQLKAYYQKIDDKAKKLKKIPSDELLGEILRSCVAARSLDPNIFCLESLMQFYALFPSTVERVAKIELSDEESVFVLKRLNILHTEALSGNDPSAD